MLFFSMFMPRHHCLHESPTVHDVDQKASLLAWCPHTSHGLGSPSSMLWLSRAPTAPNASSMTLILDVLGTSFSPQGRGTAMQHAASPPLHSLSTHHIHSPRFKVHRLLTSLHSRFLLDPTTSIVLPFTISIHTTKKMIPKASRTQTPRYGCGNGNEHRMEERKASRLENMREGLKKASRLREDPRSIRSSSFFLGRTRFLGAYRESSALWSLIWHLTAPEPA
ncbi:hypothetical protein F5887DRAFT_974956 [Amanita rubescens]|nr:hypothetical protein F5887DRAFT_974956 [Amanita rubescens]